MPDLYWRQPEWLWLILLPLVLLLINHWRQRSRWQKFADVHLIPWLQTAWLPTDRQAYRRTSILLCLFLGWSLLSISLAGPRTINWLPPDIRPDPARLVVIIDLSASMNARDVRPSRRSFAQKQLNFWLKQLPETVEVGLVVFAGHAFELMQASADSTVINHFMSSLTEIRLPTLGNDLPAALQLAHDQLQSSRGNRYLMIITDGDIEQSEREIAQTTLNNEKYMSQIKTLLIGIGGKQLVTVPDDSGDLIHHLDRPVLSHLNSQWMQQLARKNSISYKSMNAVKDQSLVEILTLSTARIDASMQQKIIWIEWFEWPLISGILLIFLSLMLQGRYPSGNLAGTILLLVLSMLSIYESPLYAAGETGLEAARQALDQKDYETARELFSQLDSYQAYFGEGISCYRLKEFDCARLAFASAAWKTQQKTERARAVFNLGNSYFHLGEYAQAVVLFRDAEKLGLEPDIVRINREFAESLELALLRQADDIRETYRRARFRAAVAGELPPTLRDVLANERSLLQPDLKHKFNQTLLQIPPQILTQKLLLALGLKQEQGLSTRSQWVKTETVQAQDTAEMLNRLFEMELGIPARLQQPKMVTGKRPW